MPMMNSEARKRAASCLDAPIATVAPVEGADTASLADVSRLADRWDQEAANEEARGNGFAAVILQQKARELRAAIDRPLSA